MSEPAVFMVVARKGSLLRSSISSAEFHGHGVEELWFHGWPHDARSRSLLAVVAPLLDILPRDMVHATEELCLEFLCPPLPDEDPELEAIHRAEERANFPDDDLDEPLGERTCSIDDPECESCT